jgi:hypothetical protein
MKSRRDGALLVVGVVAALFYSNFLLDVVFSSDHDWLAAGGNGRSR